MTYEMIVEVGQYQMRVPFEIDLDSDGVVLSQQTVAAILHRWSGASKDGMFKITNKGELRIYFGDVRNDLPFDGNWNLPIDWLVSALPLGTLWYGPPIGQPDPTLLAKATDAANAVVERYSPDEHESFTITDVRLAAQEAALSVLTASA